MIHFRCRCDEPFEVPDELAGTSFQCPTCGLLVDVPTLDDLPGLESSGSSYRLHGTPIDLAEPDRANVGAGRDTPSITARGDTRDRRMSLDEFLNVGISDEELLQIKGETAPGVAAHPKYDPFTGELITPIEVREEPKALIAEPVAAAPNTLSYHTQAPDGTARSIWWPFVGMFELPNLIVLGIVTAIHLANMVGLGLLGGLFFPLVIFFPVLLMTIAHFANIIDETGPTGIDEIPRPLRGANLTDDLFRPLAQVLAAYFIAWVPILILNRYGRDVPWVADLGLLGLFFTLVPALLLTLITSGAAINNLPPHRSLSVISAAGRDYWPTVLVGAAATVCFLVGTLLALNLGGNAALVAFNPLPGGTATYRPMLGLPAAIEIPAAPVIVAVAIYLVHVFCWQLGLIYRRHHERFNWVLQKHQSTRTDTLARLHQHRQREMERKVEAARRNIERRAGVRPPLPVAKPVSTTKPK